MFYVKFLTMEQLNILTFSPLVTVQLLELGHLGEDYPITTFFENKRFFFFSQTDQ